MAGRLIAFISRWERTADPHAKLQKGRCITGSFAILDGHYSHFEIPGSYYTSAEGINDAGQIVGWFCKPNCSSIHGFLMDATGTYQIDAPAEGSYATFLGGVNDAGFLVGSVGFHRFPAQELLVGSPCPVTGEGCRAAQRIADPLIDFTLRVGIDIKPDDGRNTINPSAHGVVPVAILGSDKFDVINVDVPSLTFGPGGATLMRRQTVDVNDDGFLDLLVHFRTEDTGITPGSAEACVAGRLDSAQPLEGCDRIQTVGGPGSGELHGARSLEGWDRALSVPGLAPGPREQKSELN